MIKEFITCEKIGRYWPNRVYHRRLQTAREGMRTAMPTKRPKAESACARVTPEPSALRKTGAPGGAVWLTLADGSFTTEETENETIRLANCSWRRSADIGDGCAELVILSRNLI